MAKNDKKKSHFALTNFLVVLIVFLIWVFGITTYTNAKMISEARKENKQEEKLIKQTEEAREATNKQENENNQAEEEKIAEEETSKEQGNNEEAHNSENIHLSYVKKATAVQAVDESSVNAKIIFTIRVINNTDATINGIAANAIIKDTSNNSLSNMEVGSGSSISGEVLSVEPGTSKEFDVVASKIIYQNTDYTADVFETIYNMDSANINMDFQLTYVSFTDGYTLS